MNQSFASALREARLPRDEFFYDFIVAVREGNIAKYVNKLVAPVMLEWWRNAPHQVRDALSGDGELNFPTSFPTTCETNLRKAAEERRKMEIHLSFDMPEVRLADYFESVPGLMAAVMNPMVTPRDVYRGLECTIVHFPFQGFITIKRADHKIRLVRLSYEPYQHEHFHVRTGITQEDNPRLYEIFGRLSPNILDPSLSATTVIKHGWQVAQMTGSMITVTHQEGSGDPDLATYTSYGPWYPHEFLVTDEAAGGNYHLDSKFRMVAVNLCM